ncbi:MAG: phosphatase PAP2 family protein [Telluria sp.]
MYLLDARTLIRIALALAIAALVILWLGNATDIDIALADAAFDPVRRQFPWRDSWLADTFNHRVLKGVLVAAGLAVIAVTIVDKFRPLAFVSAAARLRLRIVASSAVLVPLLTSLLKQASASHCPWDLAMYGGAEPYIRLLESMPAGVPAGHCMPGGHASSAMWLISLGVFWLPARPRHAALATAWALAVGFAVGWLQQLRGAHFLTHTLWSMWVAAAVVLILIALGQRRGSGESRTGATKLRDPGESPCGR